MRRSISLIHTFNLWILGDVRYTKLGTYHRICQTVLYPRGLRVAPDNQFFKSHSSFSLFFFFGFLLMRVSRLFGPGIPHTHEVIVSPRHRGNQAFAWARGASASFKPQPSVPMPCSQLTTLSLIVKYPYFLVFLIHMLLLNAPICFHS